MLRESEYDLITDRVYLAGERVPSGVYKQLGKGREFHLTEEDFLPASLDGRVACYVRVENAWKQVSRS